MTLHTLQYSNKVMVHCCICLLDLYFKLFPQNNNYNSSHQSLAFDWTAGKNYQISALECLKFQPLNIAGRFLGRNNGPCISPRVERENLVLIPFPFVETAENEDKSGVNPHQAMVKSVERNSRASLKAEVISTVAFHRHRQKRLVRLDAPRIDVEQDGLVLHRPISRRSHRCAGGTTCDVCTLTPILIILCNLIIPAACREVRFEAWDVALKNKWAKPSLLWWMYFFALEA